MQSLSLVTLFALCAASMAYSSYSSSHRRHRRSEMASPITTGNSTHEVQTRLTQSMGTMANAINREDLPTAAVAGRDIANTMSVAQDKGLVNPANTSEAHVVAGQLEQAANTGNKKQAIDAAKVMVYRATQIVNSLSNATYTGSYRQALDDETEALVVQLQNTMEALIQSLDNDNLYLASKHAQQGAEFADRLSNLTYDRSDAVAAEKMQSLSGEMKKAVDRGDTTKAKELGSEMTKVSSQIAPDKLKTPIRNTRANTPGAQPISVMGSSQPQLLPSNPSTSSNPSQMPIRKTRANTPGAQSISMMGSSSPQMLPSSSKFRSSDAALAPHSDSKHDELLANMTEASAATKSAAQTLRLDDAAKSAFETKKFADKAAKIETISPYHAEEIKKAADRVLEATDNDEPDPKTVMEHAHKLQYRVENAIVENKPEIAKNLKKIDDIKDKPVLKATRDEEEIMRAAVAEVVEADPMIPPEKKKEATDFTVKMMKEGFQRANTTHGQLVAAVEAEAAKQPKPNATEPIEPTDRSGHGGGGHGGYGHGGYGGRGYGRGYGFGRGYGYGYGRGYGYGYGYPYGYGYGYYPGYYAGYGYRNCNYYYAYGYCQGLLYGDYAYYGGYSNFFRNPYYYYRDDDSSTSRDTEENFGVTDNEDRFVKPEKDNSNPDQNGILPPKPGRK